MRDPGLSSPVYRGSETALSIARSRRCDCQDRQRDGGENYGKRYDAQNKQRDGKQLGGRRRHLRRRARNIIR
jgi:hypothetical protein